MVTGALHIKSGWLLRMKVDPRNYFEVPAKDLKLRSRMSRIMTFGQREREWNLCFLASLLSWKGTLMRVGKGSSSDFTNLKFD
ncbi:hypothetical protein YA52_00305 [Enterobacter roggenkampii]|nr:hypothetical protein YA52_00305 [Enterobacter roggenkampii]